jgi:hypothetical protein
MAALTTASSFSVLPISSTAGTQRKPRTLDASRLVRGLLMASAIVASTLAVAMGVASLFHAIGPLIGGALELWSHPTRLGVL